MNTKERKEALKKVQAVLVSKGFYGNLTIAQQKKEVDGILGKKTTKAIENAKKAGYSFDALTMSLKEPDKTTYGYQAPKAFTTKKVQLVKKADFSKHIQKEPAKKKSEVTKTSTKYQQYNWQEEHDKRQKAFEESSYGRNSQQILSQVKSASEKADKEFRQKAKAKVTKQKSNQQQRKNHDSNSEQVNFNNWFSNWLSQFTPKKYPVSTNKNEQAIIDHKVNSGIEDSYWIPKFNIELQFSGR